MPKKRTFNFKQLQGSSSASGKQGGPSNGTDRQTLSVNERLSELRKLEGKDAAQKKRDLAEAVSLNQRSVPPSLRGVLGIRESAPPKPKRGSQTRLSNRTPGPAPPRSWLNATAWTPMLTLRGRSFSKSRIADIHRNRPQQLFRFDQMTGLEDGSFDGKPSSLLHLAFKTAAENWHLFDEDDLPALAELPLRLRLRLLSYLSFYGPPIDIAVLGAIVYGTETVDRLDLGGLTGTPSLPFGRLVKFSKPQANRSASPSGPNSILDSWDEDHAMESSLISQPSVSCLSHLTHLCVSHPGPATTWRDLLLLSKHIPTVTHLSLAYWPRPTLTPNLVTATVSSHHSPDVTAGGSHYYSGIDNDLSEPASLLRQLSGNLLQLQWLDLEGCTDWVPALSFIGGETMNGSVRMRDDDAWSSTPAVTSIFVHNWKNLRYMNFSQGWLPTPSGVRDLPRQTMVAFKARIAENFMKSFDGFDIWNMHNTEVFYLQEQREADIWLQLEEKAVSTRNQIHSIRKSNACRPIEIDHGWKANIF